MRIKLEEGEYVWIDGPDCGYEYTVYENKLITTSAYINRDK